jgi:hypothetical protein
MISGQAIHPPPLQQALMEGKRSSVPEEDQPAHWKLQLQNIYDFEDNQSRRSILQEMSVDFILVYLKIGRAVA